MHTNVRRVIALVIAVLMMLGLVGCSCSSGSPGDSATRSTETTPGEFPEAGPPAPQVPPPAMNRDPKSAVYSYLLWISYAYRILNSEVASATFSEWEEVRVNSYVQLNREKARAIDQRLQYFEPRSVSSGASTATVVAREKWLYRYISAPTGQYQGPTHEVTYDTTYTVVKVKKRGWVVDSVLAAPVGAKPE